MATALKINDPIKAKEFFEAKMTFTTGPVELERMIKAGDVNLVDVRAEEDYAHGHIPGAMNLPKNKWNNPSGLTKEKINVIYCYSQTCHLAAAGALAFSTQGYPIMELEGGVETRKEKEFPFEAD